MHIFTMPNLALNVWTPWSKGSEATTKKLMDECARVCHFPNQVLRSLQTRRRQQKWVLLVSVCLLPSFDRWPSTGSIITCLLTAVQQSITLQEVSLLILPFFFFLPGSALLLMGSSTYLLNWLLFKTSGVTYQAVALGQPHYSQCHWMLASSSGLYRLMLGCWLIPGHTRPG